MTTKELINQYVTAHADNRWMDASELETLLTEFAEKLQEQMMKDAIDATVTSIRKYREENEVDFTIMLDKGIVPYVSEEDVKLIIIKE